MLEKIRVYMELCRLMDFNLTDEMQEVWFKAIHAVWNFD